MREELQRAIDDFESFESDFYSHRSLPSSWNIELALAAMREQQERTSGCEYCNDGEAMAYKQDSLRRAGYIYLDGNLLTADLFSESMAVAVCYCPMCGKKLREDKTDG